MLTSMASTLTLSDGIQAAMRISKAKDLLCRLAGEVRKNVHHIPCYQTLIQAVFISSNIFNIRTWYHLYLDQSGDNCGSRRRRLASRNQHRNVRGRRALASWRHLGWHVPV